MNLKTHTSQLATSSTESGVIAIFLATILSMLLLTTTIYASRVSVSELNQSSQIDRSEQAYYAAEAGIEAAIRQIDLAPSGSAVSDIFPEQFGCASAPCANPTQPGDTLALDDGNGNWSTVQTDNQTNATNGSLSWRFRRVYQQSASFFGTIAKDQSEQFDLTDVCRRIATGVYGTDGCPPNNNAGLGGTTAVGTDPNNANQDIFLSLGGLNFCWSNSSGSEELEVTDVWYPKTDASAVSTSKWLIDGSPTFQSEGGTGSTLQTPSPYATTGSPHCFGFLTNSANFRHIIRVRVVAQGAGGNQNNYSINYHANLADLHPTMGNASQNLYLPNQNFVIDVVGQSGDINRRVVARKLANGQLLGIFDYVLYSGDPLKDLCKIGVPQTDVVYDPFACGSVTSVNND